MAQEEKKKTDVSKSNADIDINEDAESEASELFYDGETEQDLDSTLPYKLILGLIVLAIGIFFLYIFISSISKH